MQLRGAVMVDTQALRRANAFVRWIGAGDFWGRTPALLVFLGLASPDGRGRLGRFAHIQVLP